MKKFILFGVVVGIGISLFTVVGKSNLAETIPIWGGATHNVAEWVPIWGGSVIQ